MLGGFQEIRGEDSTETQRCCTWEKALFVLLSPEASNHQISDASDGPFPIHFPHC